jgi:bifunctional non-homologous end joining protein LigD
LSQPLRIKASSFLLDGEAVIPRADRMPDFPALRSRSRGHETLLYAFDLIQHDWRRSARLPLIERKQLTRAVSARHPLC